MLKKTEATKSFAIILKWMLRKQGVALRAGFMWLKTGSSDEVLRSLMTINYQIL
jgi:hypothetical protein